MAGNFFVSLVTIFVLEEDLKARMDNHTCSWGGGGQTETFLRVRESKASRNFSTSETVTELYAIRRDGL